MAMDYELSCSAERSRLLLALDLQLGSRSATVVFEAVFGHRDKFRNGEEDDANMENKLVGVYGEPCEGVTLGQAMAATSLPPLGSLVYPRFRVATVATAGVIEFHVLGNVVHARRRGAGPRRRRPRRPWWGPRTPVSAN